jgi:ABC-type amino acid transport substrate-binding protein
MPTKNIELTYDQIDAILIDELQYAVELNVGQNEELVKALARVLRYYMIHGDYIEFVNRMGLHFEEFDL